MNAATVPLRRLFPARPGGQPWRIQLSGGSAAEGTDSAGGWCWQSHQVPPGQSS
ncbi:MAG TPA: hypothetical protein VGS06_31925 [Streptosporangiaceae bacterium]|nr:hypothetical protein [Streptosporangiaceae bacterium]